MKYLKLYEEFKTNLNIKRIMDNYLECALWTEEERLKEESAYVDLNVNNFSDDSKIKAYLDIKSFLEYAGNAVDGIDEEQLGHDIWLTRNYHGAGFFDRGYDFDIEKILMDSAHKLGEINIYVGDDNIIYFDNEV
jgi:hypothetical protein